MGDGAAAIQLGKRKVQHPIRCPAFRPSGNRDGVETEAHHPAPRDAGVPFGQGYLNQLSVVAKVPKVLCREDSRRFPLRGRLFDVARINYGFPETERVAQAFENPDFVRISLNNYRWYLRQEPGESKYDGLEAKIATFPTISAPTITLEGDTNGAGHADPSAYAKKYVGKYEHRDIAGGIGHNLPQEAPEAFAKAIIDVNKA